MLPERDRIALSRISRRPQWTVAAALMLTTLLSACVTNAPPDGTILSRLPAGSPGAAPLAPPPAANTNPPSTPQAQQSQMERYNATDRQVLRDQEQAIRDEAALAQAEASAPVYYGSTWGPAYGWYGPGWYAPAWYGPAWGGGWYGRRSGVYIGGSWGW